jgi:hypothetical protein
MPLSTPYPTQHSSITFGASTIYDLQAVEHDYRQGIATLADCAVSQRAAGANMSVDVASGNPFVYLDSPYGGLRFVHVDVSNSGTPGSAGADWLATFLPADGSNPRVDRVVLTVRDHNVDLGGNYDARFRVVAGTPTVGATLANLTGAAAMPTNSLLLANVLIPAGATSITTANIDTVGTGYDGGAPVRPRARFQDCYAFIIRSATQNLATTGTAADISFDTENLDNDGMWALADPTHLWARTPGIYVITGYCRFAFNATGTRALTVFTEGAYPIAHAQVQAPSATDEAVVAFASPPVWLGGSASTRWVRFSAMQRSGGALNINGAVAGMHMIKRL